MFQITYTRKGDFEFPNIIVNDSDEPIGRYGRMRREYLKKHRLILFNSLVLSEELYPHLRAVDRASHNRVGELMLQMKTKRNITEALKASDAMRWTGEMNNIRAAVEEIVLKEQIYV